MGLDEKSLKNTVLSDTVPAYLMLYIQARKQPEDLADNCFSEMPKYCSGLELLIYFFSFYLRHN